MRLFRDAGTSHNFRMCGMQYGNENQCMSFLGGHTIHRCMRSRNEGKMLRIHAKQLLFHQACTFMPGLAHLLARNIIAMLELIKNQRIQTYWVYLAILREHCFLRGRIDNTAHNGIEAVGTGHLCQLTLHHYRELINDGRIDKLALAGMIARTFKFILPVERS